jgi:hypothetical protein
LRAPSPTHGGTPIVSGSVSTAFWQACQVVMARKITVSGKNESLVKRFDGFATSVISQRILVK